MQAKAEGGWGGGQREGKRGSQFMPSDKASLQVLITMEESLVYLEGKQRVIVEPIKWKLSVILIALKVKTGSPRLRLALVLASLAERSCQQVASPAL